MLLGYNKKQVSSFNRFFGFEFRFWKKIEFNITNLIYAMNELVQIVVWDYAFTWVQHCVIEQAYNVDIPDGTNLVQVAFLPQNISIFENVTCSFTIVKHQYFLPIELN